MRDMLNAPDYWQTDNSNKLVMVIRFTNGWTRQAES